jgi:hypothetical protein
MDASGARMLSGLIDDDWQMRVGRKLRRTLYLSHPDAQDPDADICVGIVDSERLAAEIVSRWNRARG